MTYQESGMVDPSLFPMLADWRRECTMEDILTQLKKEMLSPQNRKLAQPPEDMHASWDFQDDVSEYRREIEHYKLAQHGQSDSIDKISFDKEMSEQVEAIQWASMNAIASLLYGPCFDDNVRKMSGRVISWINGLFIEPAPRAPFGYSPADPRTPSYSKYT